MVTSLGYQELYNLIPEFSTWSQIEKDTKALGVQKQVYTIKQILAQTSEFNLVEFRNLMLKIRETKKPGTVCTWLFAARKFCDFLIYKGLLESNWARNIPAPRIPKTVPLIPTTEDVKAILHATPTDRTFIHYSDPEYGKHVWDTLYIFLAQTGCRVGEALNARVGDFTWDASDITWTINETKTDRGRQVPLVASLAEKVKPFIARKRQNDTLFTHPLTGKPFRHHQVENQFRLRLKTAGIVKPFVVHSMRKYFIVELLRADVSVLKVMELVGHENLKTTQGYAKMVLDDLKDAIYRHPLNVGQRGTADILKHLRNTVEKFHIADDERFVYRIVEHHKKLSIEVEVL